MSGMEFYEELARQRPQLALRMVFLTRGAFTPAARAFLERVSNERMEKPFDTAQVRALVRKFTE